MKIHSSSRLSPEYVLLGFVYKFPSHGYELHQRLRQEFGNIWHASQSQTYNILKRLVTQGFITPTTVEQEKLPPRQLFHITEAGASRFETWLENPTRCSVHAIRVEFVTRLYFTQRYCPQAGSDMIRAQIGTVRSGLHELELELTSLGKIQTFNRLALELRITLLKSVIGWLEECGQTFYPLQPDIEAHE